MSKKEVLAEMSVRELQDVIYKKREQEAIDKYGSVRETPFKINEVKTLEAEGSGSLFLVRVEDGCEGWEAIVEVDRDIDTDGDSEESVVEDNIINFMMENDYYQPGDIESIDVQEMCRYSRPIFKITK